MENKQLFIEKLNSIFVDFFHRIKIEVDINMNWLNISNRKEIIEHVKAFYTLACIEYDGDGGEGICLSITLRYDEKINVMLQLISKQLRDREFNFEKKFSISDINQFYTESTLITLTEFIDSHWENAKNYLKKKEDEYLESWEPYICEHPLSDELVDCMLNYNNKLLEKFKKLVENKYYCVIDFFNNIPYSTEVQYYMHKYVIIPRFILKIPLILKFAISIVVEREITENNEDIIYCSINGDSGFFFRYDFILPTDKDIKTEIIKIIEDIKYEDYFDEFIETF